MDNIQIYVDNVNGSDDTERRGGSSDPVRTADRAFSLLPPFWRGSAEIIFAVTPEPIYDIVTDKVSLGIPSGPEATPVLLRGAYEDVFTVTAADADSGDNIFITEDLRHDDDLIGINTPLVNTGLSLVRANH